MPNKKEFEIKITGSGTKSEIVAALKTVLDNIKESTTTELESVEWEGVTLMTEIDVIE